MVLSLLWLWPFRAPPQGGFSQEVNAFTAALLVLMLLLFKPVRVPLSTLLFLGLAGIPLFQNSMGMMAFSGNAWMVSVYLTAFSLMLLAGHTLTTPQPSAAAITSILAAAFVLAASLSTWIALRQYAQLADSIWEINHNSGRPYANLAQPNNLATLLGMGLAGCLYFYEKNLLGRLSAGALTIFLLLGIVVTQSRTPWVTIPVLMLFWALKYRHFRPRLSLSAVLRWAILYAALVLGLPYVNECLQLGGVSLAERAFAAGRASLWAQLWYAVWNGPFWGYGWNQTITAQLSVTAEWPLSMMTTYSHNIMLDLLLWNGLIPGALIILIMVVWLMRVGCFAHSKESLFALVSAGFILVHSLLEFPFAYAYFLLPLGLLLGIASADTPTRYLFRLPKTVLIVILLCGLWLLTTAIADYRIIKADYQAQRMAAAKVVGFEAETPVSKVVFLTPLRELQVFRATEPRSGYDEAQLRWMKSVVQQYPYLANLYRYTLILQINGKPEQASYYLDLLCKLHGDEYCDQARIELAEAEKLELQ